MSSEPFTNGRLDLDLEPQRKGSFSMAKGSPKKFILWFNEIGIEDVPLVGGKNASLGEMYQKLHENGIRIPNGFAITAYAYRYFLKYAGIEDEIKKFFERVNYYREINGPDSFPDSFFGLHFFPHQIKDSVKCLYHLVGKKCQQH